MRNLILSALLLASAFQTALGRIVEGEWTYIVENGGATITDSTATGDVTIPSELGGYRVQKVGGSFPSIFGTPNTSVTSVTIPFGVTFIGDYTFHSCSKLSSINIPRSLAGIGVSAFENCNSLTWVILPRDDVTIGVNAFYGTSCTIITPSLTTALATNEWFVTMLATKINGTMSNYGIATQAQLTTTQTELATTQAQLTTTQAQLATIQSELANIQLQLDMATVTLATKAELTSSLTQSRTDGINSVLSNPNLWTLYTTSQIQNMAVGDLVLTKDVAGILTLNYDIEQSTDLVTWTTYQALSLPLSGLPTDKAFVRIKAKQ
jgi:hypothetical protein